ncbi:MAG: hypothetical protein KKH77_03630, partial [Candidatus Omnitrophica bacterium]|nr:hypothetical protein [Candidatus Omnitrophota bacterium]
MITKLKTGIGFKATAGIVAFSFFMQQIMWGADMPISSIDNSIEKLSIEQSQTFAPGYIQDQQAIHESMIDQKQFVEDIMNTQSLVTSASTSETSDIDPDESIELQGPKGSYSVEPTVDPSAAMAPANSAAPSGNADSVLSVTTQSGDIIYYLNNKIDRIEQEDGTVLRDLLIDEAGNLLAANIAYSDGSIEVVANGKVVLITKPDGVTFNYNEDKTISSISYPDNKTVDFLYIKDTEGAVIETVLKDPEKWSYYGRDNKLTKVEFRASNKKVEYQNGVISKVTTSDNNVFTFDIENNADGTASSTLTQCIAADGTIYRYIVGEDYSMSSVTVEKDGGIAAYNKEGALLSIIKDGEVITDDLISGAQREFEAASKIYEDNKHLREVYQVSLDEASEDLMTKATAKDQAYADLDTAIRVLNDAQISNNDKQAEYTALYALYLASENDYDIADKALSAARLLEEKIGQDLIAAQMALAAKESVLNSKITAEQALQAVITSLNTAIGSNQISLATAQENLNQAHSDKQAAQADYNNAQTDVNTKQAEYDNAKQDRVNKEDTVNTANMDLTAKATAKDQAGAELDAAIRILNEVQILNNDKQAECATLHDQYLASRIDYDAADKELSAARLLEETALWELNASIALRDGEKDDDNVTIGQLLGVSVADISSLIQAYQSFSLAVQTLNDSQYVNTKNVFNDIVALINLVVTAIADLLSRIEAFQIELAEDDVNAKQAAYDSAKQDKVNKEGIFNAACTDLTAKASAEDQANLDLQATIQSLTTAQSAKDAKQSAYNFSDQQYVAQQVTYDTANEALIVASSLEETISQDLTIAQETLAAKESVLNSKITDEQALQAVITSLNTAVESDQISLATTQENFNQALSDKQAAQAEYNNTQDDVNTKQAEYDNAKQDRIDKEGISSALSTDLMAKASAEDQANLDLQATIQSLTTAQSVKDTKQSVYNFSDQQYVAQQVAYDTANKALIVARSLEETTSQDLTLAQETLIAKESVLNSKITDEQALQAVITSLNIAIESNQISLATAQENLNQALSDKQAAQADYNNVQADVNTEQAEYDNAKQDRVNKESIFNAASTDLTAKTTAKDQASLEAETAIQNLTATHSAKDIKQAEYDTAYSAYEAAESNYCRILTGLNDAKDEEDAAGTRAGVLLKILNDLKAISLAFPQEDTVLKTANNEMEIIGIRYDDKRQIQQVNGMNGTVHDYKDGLVSGIISGSEFTLYSYDLSELGNVKQVTVDRDGIKRIYDEYGNIESLSLNDTVKIVYQSGAVKEIQKSDGTKIRNMTFSDSGELDGALVAYPDGSIAVYHDSELLQTIDQSGGVIDYEYGKIRRITKDDGSIYNWSYDGANIVIFDNDLQQRRRYLEGRLVSLEELTGTGLTTIYYYDDVSFDLIKSEICKDSGILYTYTYTYAEGLTLIHDEDDNIQAYTKDKKLSYIIDSKGRKYSYTYVGKNEGYVEVYFPSGSKTRYDTAGSIIDITEADGTVINEIIFDDNGSPESFSYIKDGSTYKVAGGKIESVLSRDGTNTIYYGNGFIRSIALAESADLEKYEYLVKDSRVFKDVSTFLRGDIQQLSLYNTDSVAHLRLSSDTLRFGTGPDGVKHVTADETLASGVYDFESLTIDQGKTLMIGPNTVIRVLGAVIVNGTIFCGGVLDIYAPTFNVGASGSVTGAVNIKCDTINNVGIITGNASLTGLISGNEAIRDDYFYAPAYSFEYNPGGGSALPRVTFPSATISSVKWYASGNGSGNSQGYAILYLYINGVRTQVSPTYGWGRGPGSFNTGVTTINGSWNNVTGIECYLETDSTIGVARVYGYEMQALIGTPTIEYATGNPGTVNTTASRPTASIKQPDYPSSGTFESETMELNALKLGAISWSQELPESTSITFQTRTGDTATPDATWSEWSAELSAEASSQIISPVSKYIQYRINLVTTNAAATPLIMLGENSPITFDYSRAPDGPGELTDIYHATVSKDGVTSVCDKNVLSKLVFDSGYLDTITSDIPGYLLNDTQKELYLKDSVIISELTAIESIDGTITEYCQGQISKITRTDGTVIKSASFDVDNNAKDFTYSKDGSTYIVKDGKIDTVTTAAGESIKYYSYGLIKSVETGYSIKEYEYGAETDEKYTTKSIFQKGSFDGASFLEQNSTAYLQLSSDTLRFGTGQDGAKRITVDETLTSGVYNFDSLTIDAGKTLIVGPDTVIKVLNTVNVSGSIFCGGALDIYVPTFNVGASGSVTGAVNIKCDTINNAGIITGNACLTGAGGSGATTDDNFSTGINGSHGANGSATVTFPSTNITRARYRASLGSYGLPAYASVYLLVNGSWTCIASYTGAGDSGVTDNTTGWSNVTGMMITGRSLNGNCVCSSFSLYEMQALIGTPTIEYIGGNPGAFNITPSRPTASIKQPDNPSSGYFESEVIKVNALELGLISWSQELPEGTSITFQTRTGDTALPDSTWSEWSQALSNSEGSDIESPGKKYLQYKINLETSDPSITPKILLDEAHGISINYAAISDNPLDVYVKVKDNGEVSAHNESGNLIWREDAALVRRYYDPAGLQGIIDPASLKFDLSCMDSLARDISSRKLSDAQKVITVYDEGNETPVEIITAGQAITYFDQGFAAEVVDKNGASQVVYSYDEEKNIIKVEFVEARQKLEENYQKALAEIVSEKEAVLARLVQAETNAKSDIEAKSADIQKQIDNERARLAQEKAKYDPSVYDLSEFNRAFREIDDYEANLQQQTRDVYVDLDTELTAARARIESDSSTAMRDLINNDYNKILGDIVQKESSPLIYQYYRKVLGRDPGDGDLLYWANFAKAELRPITAAEITQYLQDLPEYADRQTRKESIITSLASFFAQYLSASDVDKQAMLTSLGISSAEAVILDQDDVDTIISYLNSQSLHFGDSAFETIISMLKNNDINKSFEDIGKEAIKIDILTGVLTKETKGDLLISMYAMRKVAEANGLILSSQKITYDDLKDQVSRDNVIVHIEGKHYVLVTTINDIDGTITYIDHTVGQSGREMTLSRAEFMEKWKGYSLSKELSYNKDLPDNPSKAINVIQEKNIRGSGWWGDFWRGIVNFFQKIAAPIGAILLFTPLAPIGAVLLGINIVVQTVSFVVRTGTLMDVVWSVVNAVGSAICSTVLPGIFDAARGAFQAAGNAFSNAFTSIGQAIPLLGKVIGAPMEIFQSLAGAATDIATQIWSSTGLTETVREVVLSVGARIIEQGVSLGANSLFKGMGLDPSFANIGSALMTGAVMGGLTAGDDIGLGIVEGALKYGTIAGVDEIGEAADLDPNITSLAGMMAGSLMAGSLNMEGKTLTYNEVMESIKWNVASECAYLGVTEFGELLGVDPRISYLAGVGIRSTLSSGLSSEFEPDKIWGGIQQGLLQGVTNIGLSFATEELGISPLLANIGFSAISGAINAGIQTTTGGSQNVFQSLFKTYTDNALTFLGSGDPSNAWQQAAYILQILDFSDI